MAKKFMYVCIGLMVLVRCTADPRIGWRNEGLQKIPIDSIAAADTISITDTLFVRFWSGEVWDASTFSHFDTTRDWSQVEISAWAYVKTWIGTSDMPPTNLWPLTGDTCKVPPPFMPGKLHLIVRQPNDSTLNDSVDVIP